MKQDSALKQSPRSTDELLLFLTNATRLDDALDELDGAFTAPSFSQYLRLLMERRGLTLWNLGTAALLSRSFMYQICSGKRSPGRDIVLRLALAMELSVEEAQRLLRSAERGTLYPKVRRDAVILYALSHRTSLEDTEALLESLGEISLL